MPALFAIFGFAWFVGWAVTLKRNRELIASAAKPERAKAAAKLFLLWPLELIVEKVAP